MGQPTPVICSVCLHEYDPQLGFHLSLGKKFALAKAFLTVWLICPYCANIDEFTLLIPTYQIDVGIEKPPIGVKRE